MDDFWSTQQFSNLHHPQRTSFQLIPAMGSPQQFGGQDNEHMTSFLTARQSASALDWLQTDHAEAAFYSAANWELNPGQNLNPAGLGSSGDPQNWDFVSSCETPSPLAESPWFQPQSQIGAPQTLPSFNFPQKSSVGTHKADPYLDTLLPQPKRSAPDPQRPIWGTGVAKGDHFGPERFFDPNSCPLSFSHLESSMLSPPLTPLPPPSHSQGGDDNGALHFFPWNPSLNWTLQAGSEGTAQGNLRSSRNVREQFPSPEKSARKLRRDPTHASTRRVTGSAARHWKSPNYTGTPFPSLLHANQEKREHYTPRPLLDPARQGTGLYSSFFTNQTRELDDYAVEATINIGSDFQADLPALSFGRDGDHVTPEHCLWKSRHEMAQSRKTDEQVEKLLLLCSSSCLPGGGSNVELALHSLHSCQADIMATLKMLLLAGTPPTQDYHYSGTDVWTKSETGIFNQALNTHGKNFSLIHQMVRTKTVKQCVEFYYLIIKSQHKQDKQTKVRNREEGPDEMAQRLKEIEMPASPPAETQPGLKEAGPALPLAGSYPCTKCGKLFNKVKSRNAHMKIHRKFPKAWGDRFLAQSLVSLVPSSGGNVYQHQSGPGLPPARFASPYDDDPNIDVSAVVDADGSIRSEYASVLNQSWHSFQDLEMQDYVA